MMMLYFLMLLINVVIVALFIVTKSIYKIVVNKCSSRAMLSLNWGMDKKKREQDLVCSVKLNFN